MQRLRRSTPIHMRWFLPVGTLFFMCGILLGRSILSPWLMLIPLGAGLCAALLSHRWLRGFALLLVLQSIGALAGWAAFHPFLPDEGEYTVEGVIIQEINHRADGQVQTVLTHVTLDGSPAPDAHWTFYLDENESLPEWLEPGVQVCFHARVYHPAGQETSGGFSFRDYLLQRGIRIGLYGADSMAQALSHFSLRGWAAALRHHFVLGLMDAMGGETGAYAAAMLLGTRNFIPEDDRAAFNDLGVAHLLSVSGFHTGVLISLILLLLRPLPVSRAFRLAAETMLLAFYCLLNGGNAPVIRAAGLLLWREFARLHHRQNLPLHALCVTALAQLLGNPTLLTSPSFQLSYSALLGLTLVYPRLKNCLSFSSSCFQRLWESLAASLSAQLGILLPQLYWFGELPLLSVLLNIVVIPFAGLLISLYWLTLVTLPVPGLSILPGTLSAWLTEALLLTVRRLGAMNLNALWVRQPDMPAFIGWVMLLLGLGILLPHRAVNAKRVLSLAGTLLLLTLLLPLPEDTTRYTQFSVGNADAAVLQDQDMTVVIDTGENGHTLAGYLHQRRQSIELLIITHLHKDHSGGIRALLNEGIPVRLCCLPWAAETPVIDEEVLPLIDELRQSGTEIRYLSRGDVIPSPSGQLTVLWPEKHRVFPGHNANNVCLVLQADIAGTTMLLTSDLTGSFAHHIAHPADILKVPHHGSRSSVTPSLLTTVQPQLLLLSNHDEARETYMSEAAGSLPLYSTAQHGSITIDFFGGGEFEIRPFLSK